MKFDKLISEMDNREFFIQLIPQANPKWTKQLVASEIIRVLECLNHFPEKYLDSDYLMDCSLTERELIAHVYAANYDDIEGDGKLRFAL